MKTHPTTGGSYVRDPETGALDPAGAVKPVKTATPQSTDEAAPAAPSSKKGGK